MLNVQGSDFEMLKAIFLFLLADLAEIGGGYLIWQWLREDKSAILGSDNDRT